MLKIGDKAILRTSSGDKNVIIAACGYDAINKTCDVRDVSLEAFGLVWTARNVPLGRLRAIRSSGDKE